MIRSAAIYCILFLSWSCTDGDQRDNKRPNIILMMADDMGYECLSVNGSLSYQTPILDQLAANGIRFTQCHAQPLCTPSRVKIMTGRYNSHNYVDFGYLDVKEQTFGNVLRDAGYKTAVAGKWQLNGVNTDEPGSQDQNRPDHFGFDEYCLWWFTERGPRYANPKIVQNGELLDKTIDDYGPDVVSDFILDFIGRHKEVPFFVYYPMILVHSPFQPTPDSPEWKDVDRRMEKDDRYFKDMVEYTDKIVGKIITKLKELELDDKTMVLFTGDNGTHASLVTKTVNGTYPGGKGRLKDNGTHVPFVVHWPRGIKDAGRSSEDLVEFSDFLPTFAVAAGVAIPESTDGRSFYQLLTADSYTPRESIFIHYYPRTQEVSQRSGCFVRTSDYKLYSDGRFFNMKSDKWEDNSLDMGSLSEQQQLVFNALKKELSNKVVWDFSTPHRVKE